jgi:putative transposase
MKPGRWTLSMIKLATGSKLRTLTGVDLFSLFSPVIDPRFSYRGQDVASALERVCAEVGYPGSIHVDRGSEFISRDLDLRAYKNECKLDFSRPGKPTDSAFIEALNGRLRAERLNTQFFLTLANAGANLEHWRRHYNEVRPRGAIGNKAPLTLLGR